MEKNSYFLTAIMIALLVFISFEVMDNQKETHTISVSGNSLLKVNPDKATIWLSKQFTQWVLEEDGYGRLLVDGNL